MWKLDHGEGWALKNWCFWIVVLEKTLDSPLDSTEIKPVNPKGNQPWILIGRTDAEAEVPKFWPPDAKSRLIGKDPGSRKDLRAGGEESDKGWGGWMASLTQWTWVWASFGRWWRTGKPGVLQSWGRKESDMTERLNNNNTVCHISSGKWGQAGALILGCSVTECQARSLDFILLVVVSFWGFWSKHTHIHAHACMYMCAHLHTHTLVMEAGRLVWIFLK